MKIKLLFLLNFLYIITLAQTPTENLKKYWTYRDRLKKYFIAISPNNEQGTNIPAMSLIGTNYDTLSWGDGNGGMQYYIGMLATEYRLLQLYRQDYNQILLPIYKVVLNTFYKFS